MTPRPESPDKRRRIVAVAALAAALAIPAEGIKFTPYYDPPGILTVCYGSTTNVVPGRRYSLAECRQRLDNDMLAAVQTVERCVPGLPEPVHAAFADAVYNMGPTIACSTRDSTAARMLAAGDLAGACDQLPRWTKARVGGVMVDLPGLVKRRKAAREVCIKGVR